MMKREFCLCNSRGRNHAAGTAGRTTVGNPLPELPNESASFWARMVIGNHTRLQIALGILVSVVSVVLAYGLMSVWRPL